MNLFTAFLMITLTAMGCRETSKTADEPRESGARDVTATPFFLGTYTEGKSEGIYKYLLGADGTLKNGGLMARSENPSFLALSADNTALLAVNEVSDNGGAGYVSSFEIQEDTLVLTAKKSSGGAHPCHVATNRQGYVLVANYSGGNMGLLKIQEDGGLSDLLDVQQHEGKGDHPRQDGPHAHSGWFTGESNIISVDLGTNQLWLSKIDTATHTFEAKDPNTFTMEPGAGPRHLALHPEKPWIYVINELSSSVSLLLTDPESGALRLEQTLSTLPEGFSGENTCADIHLSPDGKFLYASNRGHNSIARFAVDPETGSLKKMGHESTRGETPRNFSLSPDGKYLLVANQASDNLVCFKRNEADGSLHFADQIAAPAPVCILFVNPATFE